MLTFQLRIGLKKCKSCRAPFFCSKDTGVKIRILLLILLLLVSGFIETI